MENIVDIPKFFKSKIRQFGQSERKKIHTFIEAFHTGGFKAINNFTIDQYKVRNKTSLDVPANDPLFSSKIKFAKKYNLWHFHAGFYDIDCDLPGYTISPKGDLTSQWVIHYQLHSEQHITVVDISAHPPLKLPDINTLLAAS